MVLGHCLLTLFFTTALFLGSATANLFCWSNQCANGSDWCFQTCNYDFDGDKEQESCLAQYRRLADGTDVASYFGCHQYSCNEEHCVPTEGSTHDFSCCCSKDLCNSIPDLTPTGETPTGPSNPSEPPSIDPHDGML